MLSCKPYGDPAKAKLFIIGHDPTLQRGDAQAQYAFFLNYLDELRPLSGSERRRYDLASAVVKYVGHLGGSLLSAKEMYFTNLCNEFLGHPSGGGTVLIPDEVADRGVQAIENALPQESCRAILPMSPQVFYHLARTGFVADPDENLRTFVKKAKPKSTVSKRGAYEPVGRRPFLLVCGRKYRHRNDLTPIIPIVHVKQWPLNRRMKD